MTRTFTLVAMLCAATCLSAPAYASPGDVFKDTCRGQRGDCYRNVIEDQTPAVADNAFNVHTSQRHADGRQYGPFAFFVRCGGSDSSQEVSFQDNNSSVQTSVPVGYGYDPKWRSVYGLWHAVCDNQQTAGTVSDKYLRRSPAAIDTAKAAADASAAALAVAGQARAEAEASRVATAQAQAQAIANANAAAAAEAAADASAAAAAVAAADAAATPDLPNSAKIRISYDRLNPSMLPQTVFVTSLIDSYTIRHIVVNRGNCGDGDVHLKQVGLHTLKFGEVYSLDVWCAPVEVKVNDTTFEVTSKTD